MTITRNSSSGLSMFGATVVVSNSLFTENRSSGIGCGGDPAPLNSTLTVTQSTIERNTTSLSGGGISAKDCNATIRETTIAFNEARIEGGGFTMIDEGHHTFANVTISGNIARQGGGLRLRGARTTSANAGASATLENVTIANNRAVESGGGHSLITPSISTPSRVSLRNTIVTHAQPSGANCVFAPTSARNISLGGNIEFPGQTCFVELPPSGSEPDGFDRDPRLGPLANYGGPTQTHQLLSGSPAIDRVPSCPPIDQRGVRRPSDGNGDGVARCDIGAFEVR